MFKVHSVFKAKTFFSETVQSLETNFILKLMSAKEWEQNRSNGPSHMINISAMLKVGKESFESLLLQNQLTDSLDTQ